MRKLALISPCNDLSLAARQATLLGAGAINQAVWVDTFFRSPEGFLRLREFRDSLEIVGAEERPPSAPQLARLIADYDDEGATRSVEMTVREPDDAKAFFARSLGIRGIIRQGRLTWQFHEFLVHFDEVAGLGDFIVVEKEIGEESNLAPLRESLDSIATAFGAAEGDFSASYIDRLAGPSASS
jgi:adenylate cyclase class IV